jgi:hypothetical protein
MTEYNPEWWLEFKLLRKEAWTSAEGLLVAGRIATQTNMTFVVRKMFEHWAD